MPGAVTNDNLSDGTGEGFVVVKISDGLKSASWPSILSLSSSFCEY